MMLPPLRVLYLLPAEGFGGAERQGVQHLAELPRHGVQITSFVGSSTALQQELSLAGVSSQSLVNFPPNPAPEGEVRGGSRPLKWLAACIQAAAIIERHAMERRPDVIFANRTFAWLVAAVLSRRLRVPYVMRAGSRPAHPILGPLMSLLDRVSRPSAVFYNCKAVKSSVAERFACPTFALPNVVDGRRFSSATDEDCVSARARLGLPEGVPLIGLAARPAPEKGFDLLEQVVVRVRRKHPEARFVVAGDFTLRRFYEGRFASAGVGNAVRFVGHVDAATFFRAVDMVVLTSRARSIEASPNALLEAMASCRPIVATAVGGVPELIRHGVDGYLTTDVDAEGFAANVCRLIAFPEMRAELGRMGRARALSEHRPSIVIGGLVRDLRHVLAPYRQLEASTAGVACESNTLSAQPSI
jgi:glycosyltransferase involved in cell wall biosynthesis